MTNKPVALEVVCPKGIHPVIEFWLVFKGNKENFWEKLPVIQTTYNVDTIKVPAKKYIDDIRHAINMSLVRGPFTKHAYNLMVSKLHSSYPNAFMTIISWEEITAKVDKITKPLVLGEPVTKEPKQIVRYAERVKVVDIPKRIVSSIMEIPNSTESIVQLFAIYPDENTTEVDLEIMAPILEGALNTHHQGLGSYRTVLESMAHECLITNKPFISERNYDEFIKGVLHMQIFNELEWNWNKFADKAPIIASFHMAKERDMKDTQPFTVDFKPTIGKPSEDVLDAILYAFHNMSAMKTGRADSKSNESTEPKTALEATKQHMPSSCADNHPFLGKHYPYQGVVSKHKESGALYLTFGTDMFDVKYVVNFLTLNENVSEKDRGRIARTFDNVLKHGFIEENYMGAYENAKKFYPEEMHGSKLVTFKTVMDVLEYKHNKLSEVKESKIGVPKEKQLGAHLSNNDIYSIVFENSAIIITENETGFKMPIARFPKEEDIPCAFGVIFQSFKALINTGMLTEETYNAWLELSKPHLKEWRTYSLVEEMVLGAEKNWNKKEE